MNDFLDKPISLSFDTFENYNEYQITELIRTLIDNNNKSDETLLNLLLDREILLEILNTFPQGIQVVDENGTIVYVNPEFLNILDVEVDDRIGKSIFNVSPDGSLSEVLKNEGKVLNHRNFPKGTSVELVSSAFPIYNKRKMIGAVAVISDVKYIYELSEQLKHSRHKLKNLSEQISQLSTAKYTFNDIISNSDKMRDAIEMCQVAGQSDSIVLIQGETGTGKELFANAIHNVSERSKEPFITVNCSAIPKNLLESEFFGHEKGAFTGAYKRKLGKFELANNGTLFLDELGEMDLELQPKILRAIQENEIQRVGGEDKIKLDVRIISATNRDLEQMIKNGEFRRDLYYRLNVWKVTIPPLRERKDDIEPLVNYLVKKISRRLGKTKITLTYDAMMILNRYNWPGNVRELENVVERAIIGLIDRYTIEAKDIDYILLNQNKADDHSCESGM